jgi:hypothetical protein
MTRFVSIQTNFSTGEMDPLLRARVDLPAYRNALEEATNVIIQPQGGLRRRPGLRYVTALPNTGADSAANGVRLVPFEFSVDDSYMLCFTHNRMFVFKNGAQVFNLNGGSLPYIDTSSVGFTGARLSRISWAQSADTIIITHPDIQPVRILRGATDADWAVSPLVFDAVPKYAFQLRSYRPGYAIRPLGNANDFVVFGYFSYASGRVSANRDSTEEIDLQDKESTTNDFYNQCPIEITSLAGAGQNRIIVDYTGSNRVAVVDNPWGERPTTEGANSGYFIGVSYENGTAQGGSSSTITLASGANASNDFYNGTFIEITSGTGSGQVRQIDDYVGSTKVATVATAWTTAPDNTSVYRVTAFHPSQVGDYINVDRQGRLKIKAVDGYGRATVTAEFPLVDRNEIKAGSWELESGYEDVWSNTRGWPACCTFHEGRLFFAGSRSRPSTMWGSKIGLFFELLPNTGLDDDAVEATLDTASYNAIVDIQSGQDLQIFTTGGEFYVPQQGLEPITPSSFFVRATTKNGAKEGIRVQQLETGTLFIQRQGKSLNEFAYTDTQATYLTSKISLLSGHLLRNPISMSLRKSVATDENDLLMIVNGTDGSIAAFSLLRSQNVIAPSRFVTDGEFVDVGVDLSDIYVVVKREVDGSDEWYVERFDDSLQTDSAVTGGASESFASVAHLEDKVVDIILDGAVQPNQTVSSGSVTFSRATTTSYQVGLDYFVKVVTMPAELQLQTGTRLAFRKRIVEVNAIVKDTQHLKINGVLVPIRTLDAPPVLDLPTPEFTGIKTLHGILGYTTEGKITVEQDIPLKMTLLGLEYKIATHQGT